MQNLCHFQLCLTFLEIRADFLSGGAYADCGRLETFYHADHRGNHGSDFKYYRSDFGLDPDPDVRASCPWPERHRLTVGWSRCSTWCPKPHI
jgi:hypothetical protein